MSQMAKISSMARTSPPAATAHSHLGVPLRREVSRQFPFLQWPPLFQERHRRAVVIDDKLHRGVEV